MNKQNLKIGILLVVLLAITASSVYAIGYTPKLVKDIQVGAGDSAPEDMIVFNGDLIFSADDGTNGRELWVYDGITTSMLANINPTGDSNPDDFVIYSGDLYFRANDGTTGYELWVYDGTNPPSLVQDLVLGLNASSYPEGLTVYNNNLYFAAYLFPFGTELFRYNGAIILLVADINVTAPDVNSDPYSLEVYAGKLFFNATDGVNGYELWQYDSGTNIASMAADIHPAGDSIPDELIVFNNRLYFSATEGSNGFELWQYDDSTSTASRVADIYTGSESSYPESMTVYNNKLYFSARDSAIDYELWVHDGAITSRAKDIDPGPDGSYPYWLKEFNGKLYFAAYLYPYGYELLSFDGSNVAIAADIHPSAGSSPRHLTPWGNKLFFQADDGSVGDELWELSDLNGPTVKSTSLKFQVTKKITTITVTFDEDVFDPAGSTDADDVTNPANYLLINKGKDKSINTVSCAAGVSGDDFAIPINAVTYDSVKKTATLNINNGIPLPYGKYALFVCGTTSITDDLGTPLNDGVDEIVPFEILDEILPDTGFAPGIHTAISGKNDLNVYSDLWLDVPGLGIQMDIVGVPNSGNNWNVNWLGDDAGWLEGSAFPTWEGNTVITGHVWSADGYPGPFINIKSLQHGDIVRIHAWGQVYVYEVRETRLVSPLQISKVFQHESYDWLTLVTCEDWNLGSSSYNYRRMVRAVLVDVSAE